MAGMRTCSCEAQATGTRRLVVLVGVLLGLALAGLVFANQAAAVAQTFTASLSGMQEVPSNDSVAGGTGTVVLNEAETQITVNLSFSQLSTNATAAHIHSPDPPGANAPILFSLAGVAAAPDDSSTPNQTFAVTSDQVADLRAGQMYFNVHSTGFPGGEIRGQIVAQTLNASLSGSQEVPPNASSATGLGTVLVSPDQSQITVSLSWEGLGSNVSAAHIHSPAPPGANAPVLFSLAGAAGSPDGGITPNQTFAVTPAQIALLKTGQMYFNVHTTGFPGGEIRGQIVAGRSQPAVVRASTSWLMRDALTTGPASNIFSLGTRPLVPLVGDWDGNGTDTAGTYGGGVFRLRNANAPGDPDLTFTFGDRRGFPVAGDFNGDGTDDVAVYRNGTWQVRLSDGTALASFSFGSGNWPFVTVPVAGDWNGDGTDGIGTYTVADGTWSLRQTPTAGAADAGSFVFAGVAPSYHPAVGDWDVNGTDTVGLKVNGSDLWRVRNSNSAGAPDRTFTYGMSNDFPLVWSATAAGFPPPIP